MPQKKINHITLSYRIIGKGAAKIVFIHGLGSSARDWEAQASYFASKYQLLIPDVRGHGETEKPPGPYSIPLFAQDFGELMKSINFYPAHICGISMGGMIAFQLALDKPDLVKSLIIVNSVPDFRFSTFTLSQKIRVYERLFILNIMSMRTMGKFIGRLLFPKPDQVLFRQILIERWQKNNKNTYRASMRAILEWGVADRIGKICCPVLFIAGKQDFIPLATKKSYVSQIKSARLVVIEDSRHATPIDQHEKFNQIVLDFLQSIDKKEQDVYCIFNEDRRV